MVRVKAVPSQSRVVVHSAGQAVPDQLEQRLGTRVVVHSTGQAVLDKIRKEIRSKSCGSW
jgi:hypothetical protein